MLIAYSCANYFVLHIILYNFAQFCTALLYFCAYLLIFEHVLAKFLQKKLIFVHFLRTFCANFTSSEFVSVLFLKLFATHGLR